MDRRQLVTIVALVYELVRIRLEWLNHAAAQPGDNCAMGGPSPVIYQEILRSLEGSGRLFLAGDVRRLLDMADTIVQQHLTDMIEAGLALTEIRGEAIAMASLEDVLDLC